MTGELAVAPVNLHRFLFAPEPGDIHVWRFRLDLPVPVEDGPVLSSDELARADRFHFERDRRRFVAARTFLRRTLGRYLAISPAALRFGYTQYGKPFLALECGKSSLTFNLSHSHELAVLAIARGRAIGVDVEHLRPGFANDSIAECFFAPDEVREIQSLHPELQARAFFTCWTRKEAYIKARGQGLSIPLHDFVVAATPGSTPALLSTAHDPSAALSWFVCDIEIDNGYAAALAFERSGSTGRLIYCR